MENNVAAREVPLTRLHIINFSCSKPYICGYIRASKRLLYLEHVFSLGEAPPHTQQLSSSLLGINVSMRHLKLIKTLPKKHVSHVAIGFISTPRFVVEDSGRLQYFPKVKNKTQKPAKMISQNSSMVSCHMKLEVSTPWMSLSAEMKPSWFRDGKRHAQARLCDIHQVPIFFV